MPGWPPASSGVRPQRGAIRHRRRANLHANSCRLPHRPPISQSPFREVEGDAFFRVPRMDITRCTTCVATADLRCGLSPQRVSVNGAKPGRERSPERSAETTWAARLTLEDRRSVPTACSAKRALVTSTNYRDHRQRGSARRLRHRYPRVPRTQLAEPRGLGRRT